MVTLFKYEYNIYALAKHGTRFLDNHLKNEYGNLFSSDYINEHIRTDIQKFFIIRNPEDYFYTALRTELTHEFNENVPSKGYNIKLIGEKFDYILGRMFYCDDFCWGPQHYKRDAYRTMITFKDYVNFVDLKQLSSFLSILNDFNFINNYNKDDFSHGDEQYTMSMEFMKDLLKNEHPYFHDKFMEEIKKEHEAYETLKTIELHHQTIREIINPINNRNLL